MSVDCSVLWAVHKTALTTVLARSPRTIDALGPGKVAYQMTVSKSHDVTIDGDGLKELLRVVEATVESPLLYCFVVPEDVFGVWEKGVIIVPGGIDPSVARWYVIGIGH